MEEFRTLREHGFICPGCLTDYSQLTGKALNMIFQKCHVHSKGCPLHDNGDYFWACRACNSLQNTKCGYYKKGIFIQTCITEDAARWKTNHCQKSKRTQHPVYTSDREFEILNNFILSRKSEFKDAGVIFERRICWSAYLMALVRLEQISPRPAVLFKGLTGIDDIVSPK